MIPFALQPPQALASVGHGLESAEYCRSAGFSGALLCSACKKLSEFSLNVMEQDCNACCIADASEEKGLRVHVICSFNPLAAVDEAPKFAKAILEVCS